MIEKSRVYLSSVNTHRTHRRQVVSISIDRTTRNGWENAIHKQHCNLRLSIYITVADASHIDRDSYSYGSRSRDLATSNMYPPAAD